MLRNEGEHTGDSRKELETSAWVRMLEEKACRTLGQWKQSHNESVENGEGVEHFFVYMCVWVAYDCLSAV